MPLITMDGSAMLGDSGRRPVLVFTDGDHSMGLVVDTIVDIVEAAVDVQLASTRPGFLGSAIISGRATDLVDVGHFLERGQRDWFAAASQRTIGAAAGKRVLLVDDSAFFRDLLGPLLTAAGYHVTVAADAESALRLSDTGLAVDVIVSDIEMPGLDGFGLAERLRQTGAWQHVPIVALSAHATPADVARGQAAGFTKHVAKLDRATLLATLAETLQERRAA
jgi:two-component system chemotaxis sensor kinase CheA